ncbi:hypothetical protein RHE_CH01991 [Rhizobium etli CFN 42]|uniref:Lipoprotein n=1 Tax=Rhizobium etli (strain ATCC 51251 / DSM 11541 / JCM 21823 / NBRC 15573 / CFN 42) TaxID=347834 RepID=Q2K8R0_RHIEC|nr:hypothetical protein [Rhizobium etli]ABC90776.1 hypothetical protein RHE_CH01991 [Rhizobium etli CFN 42]
MRSTLAKALLTPSIIAVLAGCSDDRSPLQGTWELHRRGETRLLATIDFQKDGKASIYDQDSSTVSASRPWSVSTDNPPDSYAGILNIAFGEREENRVACAYKISGTQVTFGECSPGDWNAMTLIRIQPDPDISPSADQVLGKWQWDDHGQAVTVELLKDGRAMVTPELKGQGVLDSLASTSGVGTSFYREGGWRLARYAPSGYDGILKVSIPGDKHFSCAYKAASQSLTFADCTSENNDAGPYNGMTWTRAQ